MKNRTFSQIQLSKKTLTALVGELVGDLDGALVSGTVGLGVGDLVGYSK